VRGFDLKRYGPVLLILFLVVTPLAIWAATSGGSGDDGGKKFYVERSVGLAGEPELTLTVNDPEVQVTTGRDNVKIMCTDATGKVIIEGKQPWPFPPEAGFGPHAHQPAPADKVGQARRCAIIGTNKKLEAEVQ
jgi:hypothetical protein